MLCGEKGGFKVGGKCLPRGGRHAMLGAQLTCRESVLFFCAPSRRPRDLVYGSDDVTLGAEGSDRRLDRFRSYLRLLAEMHLDQRLRTFSDTCTVSAVLSTWWSIRDTTRVRRDTP